VTDASGVGERLVDVHQFCGPFPEVAGGLIVGSGVGGRCGTLTGEVPTRDVIEARRTGGNEQRGRAVSD